MISFAHAHNERSTLRDRFDLLLGIVATLEVWISGELLYKEEMFPIVELRASLARWLRAGIGSRHDFEFQSMESDEEGLIWFRSANHGWRIGSIHQEFPALAVFSDAEVAELSHAFIEKVDEWVLQHCGIDATSFLDLA